MPPLSAVDRPIIHRILDHVASHAGLLITRCASCGEIFSVEESLYAGVSDGLCGRVECLVEGYRMTPEAAREYAARFPARSAA